ncbi:MAG: hypothetical protein QM666_09055 [Acinetobacter sp.]
MNQIIEISEQNSNVFCPHCQQAVLNWQQEQYIQPCIHTAFIAIDLGFEYVADVFESLMLHSVDDIHDQDLNIFNEISKSNCPDLIIFKMSLGVQDLQRYVGISLLLSAE